MKKALSEFDLIRRFLKKNPLPKGKQLKVGPGDDCAVIQISDQRYLLLTTDMLVEGVHFRRDWMTLEEIARKAIRVNLSDIAAMGGVPHYILIAVGLPPKTPLSEVDRFFRGLRCGAKEASLQVIGGDTNASDRWVISITMMGETAGRFPLTRRGARPGDLIYVTGDVGGAALGLEALRRRRRKGYGPFIQRHRLPPLRVSVGQYLLKMDGVHSLIDLSDGLAGDLQHILEESRVGAFVEIGEIPLPSGFSQKAKSLSLDPFRLALSGGEDYELLFTASPRLKIPKKIGAIPVTQIGRILPRKEGVRFLLSGRDLLMESLSGFRHF